jgi:hypothetical protein
MQAEPRPTNEDDDIGQMYSSKWISYHLSMAVETTNAPLPKQYRDILKLSKEDQGSWMSAMKDEICYGFYPFSLFFQRTHWFPTHFLFGSLCLSFPTFTRHIRGRYLLFQGVVLTRHSSFIPKPHCPDDASLRSTWSVRSSFFHLLLCSFLS